MTPYPVKCLMRCEWYLASRDGVDHYYCKGCDAYREKAHEDRIGNNWRTIHGDLRPHMRSSGVHAVIPDSIGNPPEA